MATAIAAVLRARTAASTSSPAGLATAVAQCSGGAARSSRVRGFASSASRRASHGPQYDAPTGWLFGVKPGEKYQKEGWETPFWWGYVAPLVLCAIAYGFKPDTSIQTWALEEARRRLEAEGFLEDPNPKKS